VVQATPGSIGSRGRTGEGTDLVRAARAADGSFIIAYPPTGKPVRVRMDKIAGKTVKAQWYDPRAGTWRLIGDYASGGNRQFTPPTHGPNDDWVLVLEDAARLIP
jgi:Putative collagen-binding domain of a collagenase